MAHPTGTVARSSFIKASVLVTLIVGVGMAHTAQPPTQEATALSEAEQALDAIAKKYKVKPDHLLMSMFENKANRQHFVKGGFSPLGNGVYLAPEEKQNMITLESMARPWKGAPRSESELVLLTPQGVLGSIVLPADMSFRDLTFAWFQPKKVWFFDAKLEKWGHIERPGVD